MRSSVCEACVKAQVDVVGGEVWSTYEHSSRLSGAHLPTLSRDRLLEIGVRGLAATPHHSYI